jgi:hypothetical protein
VIRIACCRAPHVFVCQLGRDPRPRGCGVVSAVLLRRVFSLARPSRRDLKAALQDEVFRCGTQSDPHGGEAHRRQVYAACVDLAAPPSRTMRPPNGDDGSLKN